MMNTVEVNIIILDIVIEVIPDWNTESGRALQRTLRVNEY